MGSWTEYGGLRYLARPRGVVSQLARAPMLVERTCAHPASTTLACPRACCRAL